jgi:predicted Na+-dependent transporter
MNTQPDKFLESRKKLINILGSISILLIFAGCVEAPDGSITWWTVLCLALAYLMGYTAKWLNDHIEITRKGGPKDDETDEQSSQE